MERHFLPIEICKHSKTIVREGGAHLVNLTMLYNIFPSTNNIDHLQTVRHILMRRKNLPRINNGIHQGSKRLPCPMDRPGPAQRDYLVGPGGPIVMIAGPGGPSYLSGRPGPMFLSFFSLFTKLYACHKRQKLLKTFYDGKSMCISDTYKVINHSNCSN